MSAINNSSGNLLNQYKVLSKNVGKWQGTVRILDAEVQELKRYQILQTWEAHANKWVLTNTFTYPDGTTYTHSFDVLPMGEGKVKLEIRGEEPRLKDCQLTASEQEDNIITFKIINNATGLPREIETITFVGENQKVRTAMLFADDGTLKGFIVVQEQRLE